MNFFKILNKFIPFREGKDDVKGSNKLTSLYYIDDAISELNSNIMYHKMNFSEKESDHYFFGFYLGQLAALKNGLDAYISQEKNIKKSN